MNKVEKRWYVVCKEIIPLLITLGIALSPLTEIVSEAVIIADRVLFGVFLLIYIIGGFYFIRKHYTTYNSYVSFTKHTFIVETILCLFGVVLAYLMHDNAQYYALALWYAVGLTDFLVPDRSNQKEDRSLRN